MYWDITLYPINMSNYFVKNIENNYTLSKLENFKVDL